LPWYTFVPIMSQSMVVYGAGASDLNFLCILYSLVYVPGVFLCGGLLSAFGCHWCFTLATACLTLGCMLRCGPGVVMRLLYLSSPADIGSSALAAGSGLEAATVGGSAAHSGHPMATFEMLATGQALCAVGQTFLVNATSHLAAEWFVAEERPAAAMISNLMNFIGGSLSFVQPTWYVAADAPLGPARQQLTELLDAQLKLAVAALALTVALYRDAPIEKEDREDSPKRRAADARAAAPLFSELCRVLSLRDFWVVNGQFTLYLTVLNTFDAVEGSLLANYGYSEALSSWTAVSFCVTSVLSTAVESALIKHPAHYRSALLGINAVLAASLLLGLGCLRQGMPGVCFVLAVGVMGFSTPGWGCSLEMGSEVCYPAREATVSSLLEAFGSIASVGGIMAAQRLIDTGQAAMVLVAMAVSSFGGGLALLGLSGRMHRHEAEDCEPIGSPAEALPVSPTRSHFSLEDALMRAASRASLLRWRGRSVTKAEFQYV